MHTKLTDIANLLPGETAYRLASGAIVTVRVMRLPQVHESSLHFRTDGRELDAHGTSTGRVLPAETHGVAQAGIGPHGHTTVAAEIAAAVERRLIAWPAHLNAHADFEALPLYEEDA